MSKVIRKGATLDDIVAKVRKDHPEAIRAEQDALIDYALRRMATERSNLRRRSGVRGQMDLFPGYAVSETVAISSRDKDGKAQPTLFRLDVLTVAQLRQYISDRTQEPKLSRRVAELERLLGNIAPYARDGEENSTVGECWKAVIAAKARKANA